MGASEGIRTPDPLITNQPLYLLSYAGTKSPQKHPLFSQPTGKRGEKYQ
jgi:hypothetical protein